MEDDMHQLDLVGWGFGLQVGAKLAPNPKIDPSQVVKLGSSAPTPEKICATLHTYQSTVLFHTWALPDTNYPTPTRETKIYRCRIGSCTPDRSINNVIQGQKSRYFHQYFFLVWVNLTLMPSC